MFQRINSTVESYQTIARIVLVYVFHLTLMSCVTLQQSTLKKQKVELTKSDLNQLNGDYELLPTDNSTYRLPLVLVYNKCCGYDTVSDEKDRVSLQVLTNNRIRVMIISDNKIVKKKILRGKMKDGYFECNSSYLSPFWVVVNAYTRQKIRIGLLADGSLVVDAARETWGFLVFMPFTGHRDKVNNLEFPRKNDSG